MIKLASRNVGMIFFILLSTILIVCGCKTVWNYPLPPSAQRTKEDILKIWGDPSDIDTDYRNLKYNADEVWVYKNPKRSYPTEPLIEERLYFKENELIEREGVTIDSL